MNMELVFLLLSFLAGVTIATMAFLKSHRINSDIQKVILQNTECGTWTNSERLMEDLESSGALKHSNPFRWYYAIAILSGKGLLKTTEIPNCSGDLTKGYCQLIQKLPT